MTRVHPPLRWSGLVLLAAALLSCAPTAIGAEDAVVRHVIDGDTIELSDGRLVRYIGLDTPELRRRARPGDREWRAGVGDGWVEDPEPFGREAKEANRRLVEGRSLRLEYDAQTHDRYGRWLAYVFVDGRMVNAALLEDGYAQLLTIPPNVKYAQQLRRAAREAREARRGLWGALK